MSVKSGGGYNSSQVIRPGIKTGPASTNKIDPRGVSQYGYATGSKLSGTGNYTTANSALRVNAGTMPQVPLGNAVALNVVGRAGPGAGREVHRSGSQGTHVSVVQGNAPQGRPIWPEYPPETTSQASLVHKRGA
jgi:hypothetical protein